ncbi:MAG: ABC transporter ATP-binding protein [Janthinobacterium lividum]
MSSSVVTNSDLRLDGLRKDYGGTPAVRGIDLVVPQGHFFALLGPSGCGKTTTLRMIAGLEDPSGGTITLGGRDITHAKPYERPVNTVFQSYALFPHLNVEQNVEFGLLRSGRKDNARAVAEMLDLVQLGGFAKRRPAQLSGGQQQRVALARALVNRPQVLLLDEPMGALDLKLRREMQLELKRLQGEVGTTFVHVTHDQEEAMSMADTVAVMNDGRVEQLGAPLDVYERPASAFVAGFVGQSNLVAAQSPRVDGSNVTYQTAVGPVRVQRSGTAGPRDGAQQVRVGVRPEKLAIVPDGMAPSAGNRVTGVVVDSSFVGVTTQYVVRTVVGEFCLVQPNLSGRPRPVTGDDVTLEWSPEDTFVVEAAQSPAAHATPPVVEEESGVLPRS